MKNKIKKVRADELMVTQGIADTRSRAKTLIMMGKVFCEGQRVDKAGQLVAEDKALEVKEDIPYVSRGGLKLEAALRGFAVDVRDKTAVDVGSSTGGFTHCLLLHGAGKVYAIDVGYGLMDDMLRKDPRVTLIERTNIRYMEAPVIPEQADLAVVDVSFISLTKVVPKVIELLKPDGEMIALIKPQFELSPAEIGKGGIVRDEQFRQKATKNIEEYLRAQGLHVVGCMPSPIQGQKGNQEYLIYARK